MLSDYIAHTFIHGSYNNSIPATKYRTKVTSNNKLKNCCFFRLSHRDGYIFQVDNVFGEHYTF
jgi:hypothetical protein